jgi:hypothetical protein
LWNSEKHNKVSRRRRRRRKKGKERKEVEAE